jgi:hypothetical protein
MHATAHHREISIEVRGPYARFASLEIDCAVGYDRPLGAARSTIRAAYKFLSGKSRHELSATPDIVDCPILGNLSADRLGSRVVEIGKTAPLSDGTIGCRSMGIGCPLALHETLLCGELVIAAAVDTPQWRAA